MISSDALRKMDRKVILFCFLGIFMFLVILTSYSPPSRFLRARDVLHAAISHNVNRLHASLGNFKNGNNSKISESKTTNSQLEGAGNHSRANGTKPAKRKWSRVDHVNFTEDQFWKKVTPTTQPSDTAIEIVSMLPKTNNQTTTLCNSLFNSPSIYFRKTTAAHQRHKPHEMKSTEYYRNSTCSELQEGFVLKAMEEEKNYPIAFTIMVYKDIEQVYRLLRAIYRPSNYYCIHVDLKTEMAFFEATKHFVSCFDNIILASERIKVYWGRISILDMELICMNDLLEKFLDWSYVINLTGQEFPLKTNLDLIKILKTFNGAADSESCMEERFAVRTKYEYSDKGRKIKELKKPPPPGIRFSKGNVHVVLPRKFVEYVIKNKTAIEFREWLIKTWVPDESFFSSLIHSPSLNIPGAHLHDIDRNPYRHASISRYKRWWGRGDGCSGKLLRGICLMSVMDLHTLPPRPELFLNKIVMTTDEWAYQCLEYLHYKRTKEELLGFLQFNTTFYENLEFVNRHI